jgi:hypothetical protein
MGKAPFEKTALHLFELILGDRAVAGHLEAEAEEVVLHQEREEHVGAYVEGVVVVHYLVEIYLSIAAAALEDAPRQQHPGRLPPYLPGAEHPVPHL